MSKDSNSATPQTQTVNQNTSNLPAYAQPYFQDVLGQAQALTNTQTNPYQTYDQNRIAGLTPEQQQTNQAVMGEGTTGFQAGKDMTRQAGLAALNIQYDPTQFSYQNVNAPNYDPNNPAQQMQAAQTGYNPQLQAFQIGPAQQFGQDQAQQYMSPYYQNVVDVQKSEALRDAQKSQSLQNTVAARQGTYGGARQALQQTENERNLNTQLGNIQATGSQAAYENAQQQFERDRAAGLGVASQNLQSQLGVQQLGTQTGTQLNLANLSNEQQANVQNQAAYLQTQGMNAQQAMQAALANQQMNMTAQQNAEQSKQFGANLKLQGLQQATASGQGLGNLAAQQQATDLSRFQAQSAVGNQQQQLNQQLMDQQYQDFLNQKNYPMQMLSYYSNILHGLPVTPDTRTTTANAPPSAASQIAGLGLGAAGIANLMKG